MSWLRNLFGGGAKAPRGHRVDQRDTALIHQDMGRLNRVQSGLGDDVVRYIMVGDNDSVLLSLQKHKDKLQDALKLTGNFYYHNEWMPGRHDFLILPTRWRPDAVRRYGEVLSFIHENQSYYRLPGTDRSPHWFRALLREYGRAHGGAIAKHYHGTVRPPAGASRPWRIDDLLEFFPDGPLPVLDVAMEQDGGWRADYQDPFSPEAMEGFDDWMRADPQARVADLDQLSAKARAYGLRYLGHQGLIDGPWFDFAFRQASDKAKGPREAALAILRVARPDAVLAATRTAWPSLKASQKVELAGALSTACGEAAHSLMRELADGEKNESVKADLLRRLMQSGPVAATTSDGAPRPVDGPDGYTAMGGEWVAASEAVAVPWNAPVSPALKQLVEQAIEALRAEIDQHNRERKAEKYFHRRSLPPGDAREQMVRSFETGTRMSGDRHDFDVLTPWIPDKRRAQARDLILAHPDLTLWHIVHSEQSFYHRQDKDFRGGMPFHATPRAKALRARMKALGADLRTYSSLILQMGADKGAVTREMLADDYWRPDFGDWDEADLWPDWAENFPLIDEAMGLAPPSGKARLSDLRALELLAHFPKTPLRYREALLDRALGDRKASRQKARDLLAGLPEIGAILVPLLKHPKSETRAGAADWLRSLGDNAAAKPLREAAKKESIPAARAAMLSAISGLGKPIADFVSSKALLADAETGLKKASMKGMEWFPFDGMPRLTRRDGSALDPMILRWWVLLAVKLKQPGGNPWFDLLLDELDPADASKLGLAIMQAWIAYDSEATSEANANAYAAAHVDATLKSYQRWQPATTREQIFSMLRNQKLHEYFRSANDQKGLLGLCGRAAGPEAVNAVRGYFRDHYTRTAQCKALIECLASNPSPVAIQFVLTIAKRWRTKGVQELAGQLVEAIAERRGWTADELADRTVPTGGFDEAGAMELPIGPRTYVARLGVDDAITLFNPEGKAVQGLPSSSAPADQEGLKEAKALLSTGRKEIKQVFEFQARRLYEALCVERAWPIEEWREHLLGHPLVRRLLQRLIWAGEDSNGRVTLFRPMDDLSLTDVADKPVDPADFSLVRLAHSTRMKPEEIEAWKAHLEDYAVKPLFEQLARPALRPAPEGAADSEILDRRGWMLDAFTLRGTANKLGYNRGQAEDGGVFFTYEKRFESLNLVAVVEFTGNGLPEENRPSALMALRFVRPRRSWMDWSQGIALKDVPAVLLSEAWNDFHAMAAAGAGFDPEWEKKAGW